MKKLLSLLVMVLFSVTMFIGCAQQGKGDGEKKVLKLQETADIPNLDTNKATDAVSFTVLGNTLEGLYTLNENDVPVPGVAESYEISDDRLTYTFTLRKDAKWSNGEDVTANDFVYSWRRLANPDTASQYQFMAETAAFKNYEAVMKGDADPSELGVTAKDDKTLEVVLEQPVPFFISLMTFPNFYPVNQKFVEEQGENFGTSIETTIFNGPYTLTKWEPEYEYILSKNENYWDKDAVDIDEITNRIIKDGNTAVNMFEAGEVDRIKQIPGELVEQYKDSEYYATLSESVLFYIVFNFKDEILANENARKAISLAFDKSYITDVIESGIPAVADYIVPNGLAKSPTGEDFRKDIPAYNSYNVEKAKEYWVKAKEELGKDTIEVEFLTYDTEGSRKISEFLQGQLEMNLEGITVKLNQQPFKNKLKLADEGQFQFEFSGWGPDYADPMTFLDLFVTESGHNTGKYNSSKYDELVLSSKSGDLSAKPQERWKALHEAEKVLIEEDAAIAPMFQRGRAILTKKNIENMNLHLFGPDYSYKFVKIAE